MTSGLSSGCSPRQRRATARSHRRRHGHPRDAFIALGITSRVALGGTGVVTDGAAYLTTC